jgi:5-formaminoimidazole-4-carboxamide-1-(beta)-D-ribofuranosyl 5'-monophosphate synthetase
MNGVRVAVATLGSHSALQIMKGARDEGLTSVLICEQRREAFYRRFDLVDEFVLVETFSQLLDDRVQRRLRQLGAVIVPHGTMVSSIPLDRIENELTTPVFGNKYILRWESSRELKDQLMRTAGMRLPRVFTSPSQIDTPVIVKFPGAKGGKGYFVASSHEDYRDKARSLIEKHLISLSDLTDTFIQEYVFGVTAYPQFFHSVIRDRTELLGVDRRYETNVDGLGRIPAQDQLAMELIPTHSVVGNIPLVLRESLLVDLLEMGDHLVAASRQLVPPGMLGAFCIEGVYDESNAFYAFEFSGRIVAGTNLFLEGSPYSQLYFDQPMSMGRRIAREIKEAISEERLDEITT